MEMSSTYHYRDAPILVYKTGALKITPAGGAHADSAGPHNAELRKRPQPLAHGVALPIHQNQLLVVVVVRRAVLHALPEDIRAEIRIHHAVEHCVRPGIPVATAPVAVPPRAPPAVQVAVLRLPHARLGPHHAGDAARIFVGSDCVDEGEGTGGCDLLCVLPGDVPAGSVAAVYADSGEICGVEGGPQHFDEVCGLRAARQHACVRRRQVGLVEKADVRDGDAGGGIQLEIFDEVVGVGLFPVARFAVRARDLAWGS
jgi:hypothetical protein